MLHMKQLQANNHQQLFTLRFGSYVGESGHHVLQGMCLAKVDRWH